MPGGTNPADGFGEFVTTSVDHRNISPYDCLSLAATIFSTTVKDLENDGIPDGIEDGVGGLVRDADGTILPNLPAIGASPLQRDILIEMDAMIAGAGTTYGSTAAPFNATEGIASVTDAAGHNTCPRRPPSRS